MYWAFSGHYSSFVNQTLTCNLLTSKLTYFDCWLYNIISTFSMYNREYGNKNHQKAFMIAPFLNAYPGNLSNHMYIAVPMKILA